MTERYTILHNNKVLYKNLTEEEYFDRMEDLSIEFYQTGFPRPQELYNIYCKGEKIYSNLTEEEYFDTMEDLAVEFCQSGTPRPGELNTEIIIGD